MDDDEASGPRDLYRKFPPLKKGEERRCRKPLTLKPDHWRTPSELSHQFAGPSRSIRERLAALRNRLINDIVAGGYSIDDATDLVENHLIGNRSFFQGGRPTLAASPDAVRIYSDEASQKRSHRDRIPVAIEVMPLSWQSSTDLARRFSGGRTVIYERLKAFRDCLIDDIANAGYSKEQATQLIEDFMIGWRYPPRAPVSTRALCASPEAVKLAEMEGWLCAKQRGR